MRVVGMSGEWAVGRWQLTVVRGGELAVGRVCVTGGREIGIGVTVFELVYMCITKVRGRFAKVRKAGYFC